jgi:hypothetical protein
VYIEAQNPSQKGTKMTKHLFGLSLSVQPSGQPRVNGLSSSSHSAT